MNLPKGIKASAQSAILLITLASSLAYILSQELIFRPPVTRSRQSLTVAQSERTESNHQVLSTSSQPKPGRLQVEELNYLLKVL